MTDNKRTCTYQRWDGKPCGRDLYDGEYCIFHSKDIEGKKDKFNDTFWKEFERQKEKEKKYDFNGFVFPGDISFEAEDFRKIAIFLKTEFHGVANFKSTQFHGDAIFMGAKFSVKADFAGAKFYKVGYFREIIFTGGASFEATQFDGDGYFRESKFLKEVKYNFNRAKFSNRAYFEKIDIEKYDSFEMVDTYFSNVYGLLEFIERNGKDFKKLKKRIWTLKTEFLPKNFKLILGEEATARYPVISRQIKDDIYLLDKKERNSKMSGIKKTWHKSFFFLWWLFADYGRSFERWAAWSIGFALSFALIYTPPCSDLFSDWWIKICNDIGPQFEQTSKAFSNQPTGFWSSLYFSIVTFTTLGFGDIVAANLTARILVTIEVIAGYIMLGGLISIFANKLARRS